jgi:ankyrin repeat protein
MPLHVATKNKQEEVAKLLISYGADVNAQDETGKTPVVYATENADLKITKLLLTNEANIKDNPELLNIAVKKECREIVEVLLEHGADVNTSDKCGRTALHFTALGKNGEVAK